MKNINKWQFIDRKVLLEHPRLTIVEDKVRLPDGATTEYVLQSPVAHHSVAIIAINESNQILLQQEYSYPPNEILWQLPGGSIQNQETPKEAALRELSEESGYTAESVRSIGSYYTNNRRSNEKQFVVVCTNLKPHKLDADPEEFINNQWVSLRELQKMIKDGLVQNVYLLAAMQLWSKDSSKPADIE